MANRRTAALAAFILCSFGIAQTALADGGPPPPASAYYGRPVYSLWQGLYAGVHAGWGESGDADGFVGGGQVGYNWQANQFVYGVEADFSLSDISTGQTVTFGGMWANANASIDWMATARGRAGVLLDPRILAYATAGVGLARASWDASAGGFGLAVTTGGSKTDSSFVWGVGVEGKLSETMSARVEYLGFTSLDSIGSDGIGVIRAGLNFKLGQ